MAKTRGRRRSSDDDEPAEVLSPGEPIADPMATRDPRDTSGTPPDATPVPEAPKVVSIKSAPVITLSTFARRYPKNAIMRAFQDVERLSQAHTRKRTRADWEADYEAFLKAPR